jgi:hypothetical protein
MRFGDRSPIVAIRFIGVVLLGLGAACAAIGPAESYTIYWFQEGGRFHYEGFGVGSLMFANIVVQIAGYYTIAALCLPLGYGHVRLRWWTRPIMMTLLIDWLVIGLPLSLVALSMLVTSKGVTLVSLPFVIVGFLLLYPVLPIVLLRFYRSPAAEQAFQAADASSKWLVKTPPILLVVSSLIVFIALALHLPLLFRGVFPLFGRIVAGLPGVLIVDFMVIASLVLLFGLVRRRRWAWWMAVAYLGLLTASITLTFLIVPPLDIVAQMRLPPLEAEAISGIPMRGYHLALFFGLIPAATLVVVVASRRHYEGDLGSPRLEGYILTGRDPGSSSVVGLLLAAAIGLGFASPAPARGQDTVPPPASQNPSPMVEHTREHGRISESELPGEVRSLDLGLRRPVRLFVPEGTDLERAKLLVHFHGAAFIPEYAVSEVDAPYVAATVHIAPGSSVYERAFEDPAAFDSLLAAVSRELSGLAGAPVTFEDVTLSAFSAGYGAIRALLRQPGHFERADAVLLLDGLHTGYEPPRVVLDQGGRLEAAKLEPFVRFARAAVAGEKRFLITHSEIFPGTFASTTETADYLLEQLGLQREAVLRWGPLGMQQLSQVLCRGFAVQGFAGNSAPDHIDHFHGMYSFLEVLDGLGFTESFNGASGPHCKRGTIRGFSKG